MSRKGNWRDNACSETLFGSLKVERLYGRRFVTIRQARDETLIVEIDAEIARLQQARTLLAGLQGRTTTAPAKRPAKRKTSSWQRERRMGAHYNSWCRYIDAQFFQPRLQPADSNWPGQCVIRIIIKTEDDECDGGIRTEKWLVEKPSDPAQEPPCTDLWQLEPCAWKSYTLAANWINRGILDKDASTSTWAERT